MRIAANTRWVLIGLVLSAGCQHNRFSTSFWNPLGLELPFQIVQKPVRVGVVAQKKGLLAPENWLPVRAAPPYAGLREALASHLGTGVQIEEFTPFQIAAHLASGRLQYALMSDADYATMVEEYGDLDAGAETDTSADAAKDESPDWTVLARGEVLVRRGLIVASARSKIQSIPEIAGKRFAFGPKDDPVLHTGAMAALEAEGVGKDEIAKEIVPISSLPNLDLLQYHVSSAEAAKEIVYGLATPAGVIEESDYESWPETGGRLLPLRFAKDNFRVLGRTEPVQSETSMAGPVLASNAADPELTEKVRTFLSNAADKYPQELHAVGLGRFEPPGDAPTAALGVATTSRPAEP